MAALLMLSRAVAVFVGAAGFLFGQMFAGAFSLGGTLAGIGGVLAGVLLGIASPRVVLASCAVGLLGAALHVYEYYSTAHFSGNYYAWFLTVPFAVALVLIAWRAATWA